MQYFLILLLIFIPIGTAITAQDSIPSGNTPLLNTVYLNLGGPAGSLASLNYERLFSLFKGLTAAGTLGIGYNADLGIFGETPATPAGYLTLPHQASLIFGNPEMAYEIGFGGTILFKLQGAMDPAGLTDYPETVYIFYPLIGCRIQLQGKINKTIRVYAGIPNTGIAHEEAQLIFIPVGTSFGLSF